MPFLLTVRAPLWRPRFAADKKILDLAVDSIPLIE
jgi:hypothetical protein